MKLKRKISPEAFEALSEHMQALYTQSGDDYVLNVEDDGGNSNDNTSSEEIAAELERLRAKLGIEREHRKNAERERDRLRQEEQERERENLKQKDDAARNAGDIEALDKSWKARLEAREAELTSEIEKHQSAMQRLLVDNVAQGIASRLADPDSQELLIPFITKRLKVEFEGEEPKTRVVDVEGKPSALSIQDLEKEIAGDKRFARVIIAGKGSGGGGRGNQDMGGAPDKKPSEMSEQELIDWQKRDPAGFRKANQSNF